MGMMRGHFGWGTRLGRLFIKRLTGPTTTIPAFTALWYSGTTTQEPSSIGWRLNCASFCAPKSLPTLIKQEGRVATLECCGEDSFAIAENDVQMVVGVADGVGSWRQKGIDPAQFSQSLMRHLESTVMGELPSSSMIRKTDYWLGRLKPGGGGGKITSPIGPGELLKEAFWRLVRGFHAGMEKPFGSSTACIISLDKSQGILETANLGDSGFLLIRRGEITLRSRAQQHRFNAPYQLMLTPEGNVSDCSRMAAIQSTSIEAGDVIIVATDGLWDNLFEDDILTLLEKYRLEEPKTIARKLVYEARSRSEDEKYESPFYFEGRKHGLHRLGGKMDDITVVVAVAQYLQR